MNAAEFWAARDAWTAATIARQAAAPKTKRRRPLLLEQQRKWTINASKYLASRPKILAASVAPPDLRSPVLALLDAVPRALAERLDDGLTRVAFAAFRDWPVASGYSKSAIFLTFLPEGSTFEAAIGNAAPYSPLIKGNVARDLLGKPAKAAAQTAIVEALASVKNG